MQFDSLNHFKSIIAFQFFVGPADDDYLIARWLYLNGFSGFYWHAAQSIEKYLKASLVLNDFNVKPLGHDIFKLFNKYQIVYGQLSADVFVRPPNFEMRLWRESSVGTFISHVGKMGKPDSRYGLTSWTMEPDNLVKYDLLCRNLRRNCVGLKWVVGEGVPISNSMEKHRGKTFLEALTMDRNASAYNDFKDAFKKIERIGDTRGDLHSAWNYARNNDETADFEYKPLTLTSEMGWMKNSRIYLLYSELSKRDEQGALKLISPLTFSGTRWLIDNIKLDKDVVGTFEELLDLNRAASNKVTS